MAKQSLGRGLGELMGDHPVAGAESSRGPEQRSKLAPGVSTLVERPTRQDRPAGPAAERRFPVWVFFAADFVLIQLALLILWTGGEDGLGIISIILASLALAMGCFLAICGVLLWAQDAQ